MYNLYHSLRVQMLRDMPLRWGFSLKWPHMGLLNSFLSRKKHMLAYKLQLGAVVAWSSWAFFCSCSQVSPAFSFKRHRVPNSREHDFLVRPINALVMLTGLSSVEYLALVWKNLNPQYFESSVMVTYLWNIKDESEDPWGFFESM